MPPVFKRGESFLEAPFPAHFLPEMLDTPLSKWTPLIEVHHGVGRAWGTSPLVADPVGLLS